jgi:peptidoglycan/xylan/chitin deacetylase (PgdA/CDA1 family)
MRVPGAANIEYSPSGFARLMDQLLDAGLTFISMDTLAKILSERQKSDDFISITFDDGYEDNYSVAYPILKARGIPFTIYVTTSFPDQKSVVWWYILEDLLNTERVIEFEYKQVQYRFDTSITEDKQHFGGTIRNLMKSASLEDLSILIYKVIALQGLDPLEKVRQLSLSWAQIRELSADPLVTIGAHTENHLLLKELPIEVARSEITNGRLRLEEMLAKRIEHFAFPFGGANAAGSREFQLVRDAGFKTGVTTRLANIFPTHSQHLECLPRIDMGLFPDFASLKSALDGWVPARMNHFKRVVTE